MENFENGSFGKLSEKWNFEKLNLKIGTFEYYFKNEISENLKIGTLENYFENWSENEIIWKSEILKIIQKNNLWKWVSIMDQKGIWACLGLHGKGGHAWVGPGARWRW